MTERWVLILTQHLLCVEDCGCNFIYVISFNSDGNSVKQMVSHFPKVETFAQIGLITHQVPQQSWDLNTLFNYTISHCFLWATIHTQLSYFPVVFLVCLLIILPNNFHKLLFPCLLSFHLPDGDLLDG